MQTLSRSAPTLWGISVGPGDAEWLTLKGLRILQSVPVVALPQSKGGGPGMAYEIVKDYLKPTQVILPLALPFVRDEAVLQEAWQAAIAKLLPALERSQDVAFLSEGDVSFYSTFTYIAQTLHNQAPWVQIKAIPGVCSPLATAAALNTPLAIGGEKVLILPALYNLAELDQALAWAEVVVLMKVASVFPEVWQQLNQKGLLEHTSLVEWVGWQDEGRAAGKTERVFSSLVGLANYTPPYFSILIVRRQLYGY